MVQCSIHASYQLPNDLARVRKLIRSIESSDPKLLAAISKLQIEDDLNLDFEVMSA